MLFRHAFLYSFVENLSKFSSHFTRHTVHKYPCWTLGISNLGGRKGSFAPKFRFGRGGKHWLTLIFPFLETFILVATCLEKLQEG